MFPLGPCPLSQCNCTIAVLLDTLHTSSLPPTPAVEKFAPRCSTRSCAASSMAQSAYHLLDPHCPCMRCAWHIRHAAFGAALSTSAPGRFIMNSSSDDESQDVRRFLTASYGGSAARAATNILNPAAAPVTAVQALIAPALRLRKPDMKHLTKFPTVTGGFDDDCFRRMELLQRTEPL